MLHSIGALAVLAILGFADLRKGNPISMSRQNSDGTATPLTLPTTIGS